MPEALIIIASLLATPIDAMIQTNTPAVAMEHSTRPVSTVARIKVCTNCLKFISL